MLAYRAWFLLTCLRSSARNLILVAILGFIGVTIYAAFMSTVVDLFMVAMGIGMFLGGIQALSRSYFARLAPQEKQGEFFGLFDVFNKS